MKFTWLFFLLCSTLAAEPVGRRLLFDVSVSKDSPRSSVIEPYGTPLFHKDYFMMLAAGLFSSDAGRRQITWLQALDTSESRVISRRVRLQGSVEILPWADGGMYVSYHRYAATGFREELSAGANRYFVFLREASAIAGAYPDRSLSLGANGFDAAYFVRTTKIFQTASNGLFLSLHKPLGAFDPYVTIAGSILSRTSAYAAVGVRFFPADNVYLLCEGYSEFVRMRIPDYSAGGTTWGGLREEGVRIGAGFALHLDPPRKPEGLPADDRKAQ